VSCHSSSAPAARLDLTKLSYEPTNPDNFATWVKVHDRVSAGEMPPSPIPRPVGTVNSVNATMPEPVTGRGSKIEWAVRLMTAFYSRVAPARRETKPQPLADAIVQQCQSGSSPRSVRTRL
jgi:hypothetical protein